MASKRNRIARSSSLGEIGMDTQIWPIEPPAAQWDKKRANNNRASMIKPSVTNHRPTQAGFRPKTREPPRGGVLTVGSPIRETNNDGSEMTDESYGVFLESCFLCKKRITQEDDVFMYSFLRAFCSPACRDKKIASDEKEQKRSFGSEDLLASASYVPKYAPKKKLAIPRFK